VGDDGALNSENAKAAVSELLAHKPTRQGDRRRGGPGR
jgi:hypothetical protein